MTEKTLASPKPSEIPIANNFKKVFRQYGGILSGMVVLIILFSFINDSFFTANNITNIILQVCNYRLWNDLCAFAWRY